MGGGNVLSSSEIVVSSADIHATNNNVTEKHADADYSEWEYKGFMRNSFGWGFSPHLYNDSTTVERRYLLSDPEKVQYRFGNIFDTDSLIMEGDTRMYTGKIPLQRSNWVVDKEGYVDSCFMFSCNTVYFSEAGGYIGFVRPEFSASTDYENYKSVYYSDGLIAMQIDGYEVPVLEYEKEACYDRDTREAVIKLHTNECVSRVRYYLSDYIGRHIGIENLYNDFEHASYATDEIRVPLDSVGCRYLHIFTEDSDGRWIAGGIDGIQGYQVSVSSNIVENREWVDYGDITFYCKYLNNYEFHCARKCLTPADKPGSILRIVNPLGLDTPFGREYPDNVLDNDEYYIDINIVDQDHCYTSYRPVGIKSYNYLNDLTALFSNTGPDIRLRLGYSLEELIANPYGGGFAKIKNNRIAFNEGTLNYVVALPGEIAISDDAIITDDSIYYELTISDAVAGVKYVLMPGTLEYFEKWVDEIRNGAESVRYGTNYDAVTGMVQTIYADNTVSPSGSKRTLKIEVSDYIEKDGYYVIAVPFGYDGEYMLEYVSALIKVFKKIGIAHFVYDDDTAFAAMGLNEGCTIEAIEELGVYRLVRPFGTDHYKSSKYMYIIDMGSKLLFAGSLNMKDVLYSSYVMPSGANLAYMPRSLVGLFSDTDCYMDGDSFIFPEYATCVIDYNEMRAYLVGDLVIEIVRPVTSGLGEVEFDDIQQSQDGPVEYYDLMGRRVLNPGSGMYIRRQGSTVSKVLIK